MRRWWASERGQGATEYGGVIVIASLLTVAILMAAPTWGQQIVCEVGNAIASSTNGAASACTADSAAAGKYDIDRSTLPTATREQSSKTQVGGNARVVAGELVDQATITTTTNADGSGSHTVTNTYELAAGVKFEAEAPGGKGKRGKGSAAGNALDAAFEARAMGRVTRIVSETHDCPNPSACAEFEKNNADADAAHLDNQGIGRFGGSKGDYGKPDKTSETYKGTIEVGAEASGDFKLDSKDPVTGESDGKLGVGGSVKVDGEVGYAHTTNRDGDGNLTSTTRTVSFKGDVSGEVHGSFADPNEVFGIKGEGNASTSYAGQFETSYDPNGNLETITFTSTAEGANGGGITAGVPANGGDVSGSDAVKGSDTVTTTVTTTLDVSSLPPEKRQIAEDYVSGQLTNGALRVPSSTLNPNKPSSDPFSNLLYEEAKVSRVTQSGSKITEEGGIDLFVAEYRTTDTTSNAQTVAAQQLGTPGPDGVRTYENVQLP